MRPLTIGLVLLLVPGLAFSACSQDPGSQTAGSATGEAPNCDAVTVIYGFDAGNSCDVCLHEKCCAQVAACPDKACLDCVNYSYGECQTNIPSKELDKCLAVICHDPCHPDVLGSGGAGGGG
jgi:hypothetical protein